MAYSLPERLSAPQYFATHLNLGVIESGAELARSRRLMFVHLPGPWNESLEEFSGSLAVFWECCRIYLPWQGFFSLTKLLIDFV